MCGHGIPWGFTRTITNKICKLENVRKQNSVGFPRNILK